MTPAPLLNWTEGKPAGGALQSVGELIDWSGKLREELLDPTSQFGEVWFRGVVGRHSLAPGIYRSPIWDWVHSKSSEMWYQMARMPDGVDHGDQHQRADFKLLNFERQMVLAFQSEGGGLVASRNPQELYFLAQHYGLPTRLLDWTTNPLIALFMAIGGMPDARGRAPTATRSDQGPSERHEDVEQVGFLFAMEPTKHLCQRSRFIRDEYHPDVTKEMKSIVNWELKVQPNSAEILPVSPRVVPGRIERQASRFTLHCYGAHPAENESLVYRRILRSKIETMKVQLTQLGINQFSVYNTLDRLTAHVKDRFLGRLPASLL